MRKSLMSILALVLFSLVGLLLGTAIWGIFAPMLRFPEALLATIPFGTTSPATLNLSFVQLTVSIVLYLNWGSLIGLFVGFYLYTRK